MADFETARRRMVDNQLRTSNVTDRRLLQAMGTVPREKFLPEEKRALAYADVVHQLDGGRALASPAPFAKLVQLADIRPDDVILDVGAGSGYSSAVLALLGKQVTALESEAGLAEIARATLAEMGASNARVVSGPLDGSGEAPDSYDVVMIEGMVPEVPSGLFRLLRDGGRLVALVGGDGSPSASVFVRTGEEVARRSEFNTTLPPLAPVASSDSFVF